MRRPFTLHKRGRVWYYKLAGEGTGKEGSGMTERQKGMRMDQRSKTVTENRRRMGKARRVFTKITARRDVPKVVSAGW